MKDWRMRKMEWEELNERLKVIEAYLPMMAHWFGPVPEAEKKLYDNIMDSLDKITKVDLWSLKSLDESK